MQYFSLSNFTSSMLSTLNRLKQGPKSNSIGKAQSLSLRSKSKVEVKGQSLNSKSTVNYLILIWAENDLAA
jgi:hypothetical protein